MGDPALLAIDSSTDVLCVAACKSGREVAWSGEGGARASQTMLGRIRHVLRELSMSLDELDAIGFGRGPGAFTGLRAACAVAQGLAFGLGKPVVPVDSLRLAAEAARAKHLVDAGSLQIGVVMDARMGEVYAGRYAWDGDRWSATQPPALWIPSELLLAWGGGVPPTAWTGTGLRFLEPHAERRELPVTDADRARALLRLLRQGWDDGEAVPASQALPLYVRDKVALTTAERAAVTWHDAA